MTTEERIAKLETDVAAIQARNQRVEADKDWETSGFRKFTIFVLTYLAVAIFIRSVHIGRPWTGAIVPAAGFLLSTMTFPVIKRWWIERRESRNM